MLPRPGVLPATRRRPLGNPLRPFGLSFLDGCDDLFGFFFVAISAEEDLEKDRALELL